VADSNILPSQEVHCRTSFTSRQTAHYSAKLPLRSLVTRTPSPRPSPHALKALDPVIASATSPLRSAWTHLAASLEGDQPGPFCAPTCPRDTPTWLGRIGKPSGKATAGPSALDRVKRTSAKPYRSRCHRRWCGCRPFGSRRKARVATRSGEARRPSSSTTKRVLLLKQCRCSCHWSLVCWTPTSHTSSNLRRRTFVQTRSAGQPTARGIQAPAIKRRRRSPPPRRLSQG
jgi:hypothetical protein